MVAVCLAAVVMVTVVVVDAVATVGGSLHHEQDSIRELIRPLDNKYNVISELKSDLYSLNRSVSALRHDVEMLQETQEEQKSQYTSVPHPINSCSRLAKSSKSCYYWALSNEGSAKRVYCYNNFTCRGLQVAGRESQDLT